MSPSDSSPRVYFLLDESCPAKEIPRMMCRVVTNYRTPLADRFAPFEDPKKSGIYPHNTNNILPDILPAPIRTINRKGSAASVPHKSLWLTIGSIFRIHLAAHRERQAEFQAAQVDRYALNNPSEVFKELMNNQFYARDVRALLEETGGKAWLVTGFLTTGKEGAKWIRSDAVRKDARLTVTVPVQEAIAGVPQVMLPGGGGLSVNPGVGMGKGVGRTAGSEMVSPDQEIFAVAYAEVMTRPRLSGFKMTKVVKVGSPKRPNSSDLTFGGDGQADDADGSSSKDVHDTDTRSEKKDGQEAAAEEAGDHEIYLDFDVSAVDGTICFED